MIFAIEGPLLQRLLTAGHEVVSLKMFLRGIFASTEHAVRNAVDFYGAAFRATSPAFKSEMQRLFMPLPIIFRREGICTERALEDAGGS